MSRLPNTRGPACASAWIAATLLACSPLASAQIDCAAELFGTTATGSLFRVNIATGTAQLIGPAPLSLTEIEFDAASAELWTTDGALGASLRRLDPLTGAQIREVALNPAGPITGLEFVGNTLFGTRIASSGLPSAPSSLVTVDRTTGTVTTIGATGINNPVSGLAYDKQNAIMYGVVAAGNAVSSLVRIDLATGAATNIGSVGFSRVGSIEFGGDGTLYGGVAQAFPNPGTLVRINTATGAGTLVGSTGFPITGLAACTPGVPRTFVSVNGNDANACSASAPCRTLANAITKTVALGEIQILDSGGYGGLTIDKSIAISAADGVYAGVTVSSGTGIAVDAGPSGRVALRGLSINGLGGTRGIDLQSAAALYVDNCTISGFSHAGVHAQPAQSAAIYLHDSALRQNAIGIIGGTTAAGALHLAIDRSSFEGNTTGLQVSQRGASGTIRKSRFTGGATGIAVEPAAPSSVAIEIFKSTFEGATEGLVVGGNAGAIAKVTATGSLFAHNGTGIRAAADGTSYVTDSTITRNAIGLQLGANGTAVSFGDNRLVDNTADGAFSSTVGKL